MPTRKTGRHARFPVLHSDSFGEDDHDEESELPMGSDLPGAAPGDGGVQRRAVATMELGRESGRERRGSRWGK